MIEMHYLFMFQINKDNMNSAFVKLRGTKISYEKGGELDLSHREIASCSEIKGLENARVKVLDLSHNKLEKVLLPKRLDVESIILSNNRIESTKELSHIKTAQMIDLSDNPLSRVEGLENMNDLKTLFLDNTKIPGDLIEKLGGTDRTGFVFFPSRFVDYCKRMQKDSVDSNELLGFL